MGVEKSTCPIYHIPLNLSESTAAVLDLFKSYQLHQHCCLHIPQTPGHSVFFHGGYNTQEAILTQLTNPSTFWPRVRSFFISQSPFLSLAVVLAIVNCINDPNASPVLVYLPFATWLCSSSFQRDIVYFISSDFGLGPITFFAKQSMAEMMEDQLCVYASEALQDSSSFANPLPLLWALPCIQSSSKEDNRHKEELLQMTLIQVDHPRDIPQMHKLNQFLHCMLRELCGSVRCKIFKAIVN